MNVCAEPVRSLPNSLDYDNLDIIASNLDPWAHLQDSVSVSIVFVIHGFKSRILFQS